MKSKYGTIISDINNSLKRAVHNNKTLGMQFSKTIPALIAHLELFTSVFLTHLLKFILTGVQSAKFFLKVLKTL